MNKKFYAIAGGALLVLVGIVLGPTLLLQAIGNNNRITDTPDNSQVDTSYEHRNPSAPIRNAREQKIYDIFPKLRDKAYPQALPSYKEKNVPWNFYATEKWPMPSTYSDFGTRYILLPFDKHGKLGMDLSYIGVQGPQSNIYPMYNTLAGRVVALSDNETIAHYAVGGSYPNKSTDTCDPPAPSETPYGPLGKSTKVDFTGEKLPYGSFVALRNSRWICQNYSEVYKAPGGDYYSDPMRPAPSWKSWGCQVNSAKDGCDCTPEQNPCGGWNFIEEEWDWEIVAGKRVWTKIHDAQCIEKPLCTTVPELTECIAGHGEFTIPDRELGGHAMMKVPDYEIHTSHLAGGNRATDTAMDGSLGKMMVSSKAGKPSIKSMLYFVVADSAEKFFITGNANLGTSGSSAWQYDTLVPMIHYEVFRNLERCDPGSSLEIPIKMTSIDPYTVTNQYIEIDPLATSPCKIPPGYSDSEKFVCDLVLKYDGSLAHNEMNINQGRGGYHNGIYDNGWDDSTGSEIQANVPDYDNSVYTDSFIMPDTTSWTYPQPEVVYTGYENREITN